MTTVLLLIGAKVVIEVAAGAVAWCLLCWRWP